MSAEKEPLHLPSYDQFIMSIDALELPISVSELHGTLCGYLCAGKVGDGENFIRALAPLKKNEAVRRAILALFEVFSISHHQLLHFDFEFELMLPGDEEDLFSRARAFTEWCEGFVQGMTSSGVGFNQLHEEESQDALKNLLEFAHLDYNSLEGDEDDEKAFMEISEYTRMAILRIYSDLSQDENESDANGAH